MTITDRPPVTDRSLAALTAAVPGDRWDCAPHKRFPFATMRALTPRQALEQMEHALTLRYTGHNGEREVVALYSYNTHISRLPDGLTDLLPLDGKVWPEKGTTHYNYRTVKVRWHWEPNRGNGLELGQPNVRGLVYTYESDGVVLVEYGCAHQMVTTTISNCYHQTRCSVCGYTYHVDSGD